jgi:aminoglycoside phosphotransferase (APT) family kinase protein
MPLQQGRASRVTDLGDGTILRVGGMPQREARIMDHAQRHGFPVPRVREVRADALILERISGRSMGRDLRRRPWMAARHVQTLAELHDRLHLIPFEGARLVHFDLHPDNVLMSASGPVVIDWTNARSGDGAQDVAMTWLILETSAGLPGWLLARLFRSRAGTETIRRGLPEARAFRLADPNVREAERARARRAVP